MICSHGQTVYHWVEGAHALGTLQLGQPAFIAERTGATVVADVRARDVAAGGHGAPLASLLDVLLLGARPDRVRGSLNLGGISNVTVVGPDREPLAYDIGPANALVDAVVAADTGGARDLRRRRRARRARHGRPRAARGVPRRAVLRARPAEVDRQGALPSGLRARARRRPRDLDRRPLATLTALSAETVADDLKQLGVADVVAAGGGTRNPTLMAEIARRLPGVPIETFDVFGIPEAGKEALVFAIIGFLTVHRLPATVPSCTGARHASILGAVVPGDRPLRLAGGAVAPSSLTVRTPLRS